ncbi:MAG: CoA-binding protein [Candidatus Eisenbacteria bacterium]|nr:CoA-binding protein [Candidatus Eisenbacteria bacterium]
MTRKESVKGFMAQGTLALLGASRSGRGFGNLVMKELTAKGYRVLPVHPGADAIDGVPCRHSLAELAEPVGGALIVLPAAKTEQAVRDAAAAGIRRVWIQQGSDTPAALRFCEQQGIAVVHGECILMFAEPTAGLHRFHRGLWRLLGKLPK